MKKKVDDLVQALKKPQWHYESRLKSQESFALKLETGRFEPHQLEDFFACTIVVENQTKVREAKELIVSNFDLQSRRPKSDDFTHKKSDSFPFDDLRLYVRYKDDPRLKPSGITDIIFEVQIKTFLQHAWSIATHDFIYKSDSVSWAKSRIAFQIKAMLEHAEISIETAETLSTTPTLSKNDQNTKTLLEAISLLNDLWDSGELSSNIVRLAENLVSLNKALNIDLDDLREIIFKETQEGRGTNTLNLSPFSIIVQSLINQVPEKIRDFLQNSSMRYRLFVPREVELPPDLEIITTRRLVRIVE